ncbi:MAG: GAF domain-containing sensor histidine kinase, partial [Anaerolineales bacterium]|nr:GAF domain-containing sensor histidine kinase [Anaerolineales bacterium]
AAMAIENARLFQQTDQALARRVEELTLFQRIDRALHKTLDLNHILNLSLDWAVDLTYADGGSIGLLETDENGVQTIRILAHRSQHKDDLKNRILSLAHPVIAEVVKSGEAVHTSAATAEQAIDGTPASVQLVVPIKQEGELMGIIALESHLVTVFVEEDIEFVIRMADRAAVAIKNASLYEQIQAAHEARSKFTSLVTHELRLPLTSIKGYTDLLTKGLAGQLSDQQLELLAVVKRNANRMSILLSDLSDINRLESGRMNFNMATFDIREVVDEVTADLREVIDGKQQSLTVEMPETAVIVNADRDRVAQIISNLLSNANKYTAAGGQLTIAIQLQDGTMQLDVIDNGIGISEVDQKQLFQQFFRSEDEAVRRENGWGLGLTVVEMFVKGQGGEIDYESELGVGSRFSFILPLVKEAVA